MRGNQLVLQVRLGRPSERADLGLGMDGMQSLVAVDGVELPDLDGLV